MNKTQEYCSYCFRYKCVHIEIAMDRRSSSLLIFVFPSSPILTSGGSKVRRVHDVAREMESRIKIPLESYQQQKKYGAYLMIIQS